MWADVIVLQFPVFWFSLQSLMHRWMEDTFLHGFSLGSGGIEYAGSISTGAVSYAMRQEPGQMETILGKAEEHARRVVDLISRL